MKYELKSNFYKINDALLNYEKPSIFFEKNINTKMFDVEPFNIIKKLKEIEQNPTHHPEGNVYNHTMLTIDQGATTLNEINDKDKQIFMWGLLLHDIGKIPATRLRKGRWTAYDHDKEGESMAIYFLSYFDFLDEEFINRVSKLVRWHMNVLFISKGMTKFADPENLKKETDVDLIAKIAYCDRAGRTEVDLNEVVRNIELFIEAMRV